MCGGRGGVIICFMIYLKINVTYFLTSYPHSSFPKKGRMCSIFYWKYQLLSSSITESWSSAKILIKRLFLSLSYICIVYNSCYLNQEANDWSTCAYTVYDECILYIYWLGLRATCILSDPWTTLYVQTYSFLWIWMLMGLNRKLSETHRFYTDT